MNRNALRSDPSGQRESAAQLVARVGNRMQNITPVLSSPPARRRPKRAEPPEPQEPASDTPEAVDDTEQATGHRFYTAFRRKRHQQPALIAEQIAGWGDRRSSGEPVDSISYTASLCMVLAVLYGPRRKDTLLHAALIAARLEAIYLHNPEYARDGFYKFVKPVPEGSRFHGRNYKPGDSWCESLFFTWDMWNSAFPVIGVSYPSLGEWRRAVERGNPFLDMDGNEKLYAAVHDNQKGYSWFFRNHRFADRSFAPPPAEREQ